MELNREQIVKALECCSTDLPNCHECPYKECKPSCFALSSEALALIRELTEEIEKLGIENFDLICELSRIKENTVRKMQERLNAERGYDDEWHYNSWWGETINQIAKEMLEKEEDDA